MARSKSKRRQKLEQAAVLVDLAVGAGLVYLDNTNTSPRELMSAITEDAKSAQAMLTANPTPFTLRMYVRTMGACLEGVVWALRLKLLQWIEIAPDRFGISRDQEQVLRDVTLRLTDRGDIEHRELRTPTATSFHYVVQLYGRMSRRSFSIDKSSPHWQDLKFLVETRNRIVHPKSVGDLEVSIDQAERCEKGYHWAIREVNRAHHAFISRMRRAPLRSMARELMKHETAPTVPPTHPATG